MLFLALILAVQTSGVQTALARFVSGKLGKVIDGQVEIGAIRIQPFNAVTIKDVLILDNNPCPDSMGRGVAPLDTLAYIGRLSTTLSPASLIRKKRLELGKVEAEDVLFQLAIEPSKEYSVNLTRIFRIGSSDDSSPMPLDTLFTLSRLDVKNARYRMVNFCTKPSDPPRKGLNFEDLDLRFDLKGHDISFREGRVFAVVDYLHANDKCGYTLERTNGTVAVGRGHVNIRDFHTIDNAGSDVWCPRVDFNYENNPTAWSNFLRDVELDIDIGRSHLVFHTVGNYSGSVFYGCPLQAELFSGRFKGPVSDFKVTNLKFTGTECGVNGVVDASVSGIPNPSKMYITGQLHDVRFTAEGLEKLLADVGAKADLSKFAKGTEFTANGSAAGYLKDLNGDLLLTSALGTVRAEAGIKHVTETGTPLEMTANLSGSDFDLGRLMGSDTFGRSTFTAKARATLGKTMRARLEQFDVKSIEVLGYEYKDIAMRGGMEGTEARLRLSSLDPNALIDINADIDWKRQAGRLEANFKNVDLATLNLDTRGGKSVVSFGLSAEQGLDTTEPAQINISGLTLTNDGGTYEIGDILALARLSSDNEGSLILNSKVLDAKYTGTVDFPALISDIRAISTDRYLPAIFNPKGEVSEPEPLKSRDCSFSAVLHDTKGVLAFLLPELSIESGTAVNVDIDNEGRLLGYITAPGISYNNMKATGLALSLGNLDDRLGCTVGADRLSLGNFSFDNAQFSAEAAADLMNLALMYDDAEMLGGGSELNLDAAFSRDDRDSLKVDVTSLLSVIRIKGREWELSPSSLSYVGGQARADGFKLTCDDQSIALQGGISRNGVDTLLVRLHKLDLSVVNSFTGSDALKFEGIADGDVVLLSPLPSELGLSSALTLRQLGINGKNAGDFDITGTWDDKQKAVVFKVDNTLGEENVLTVNGRYGTRDGKIGALANLNGFDVSVAQPFLKSILTEMGGKLYGSAEVGGKTSDLRIASDGIMLDSVRGRVTYTNVAYTLNGTMSIAGNTVSFNNIGVRDDYGGMGVLQGKLSLGNFKSPRLDANLDMSRLKAIDIPIGKSTIGVYGDLAISGSSGISGPFNALAVDADIRSAGSGSINVPIGSSSAASSGNLLTFKAPDDGTKDEEAPAPTAPASSGGQFSVHARIGVSPDVTANIEIDKDSGHVLTAGGTGAVVLDLVPSKNRFQLKGDYLIDKGKYLLSIPGIVSKEFDIKEGSSLKFNGDVMESTLDISAVHIVKTSLSTLVPADSTTVSSRRAVECGLNITGKLRSPEVAFSINVPDLEPSTQMHVDAALGTADKVQKQFVALLLFGTFLPEENSGIVNGTNMIYSNVGEIVAGQLNNILQKLDIPVDFGFGYQQDNVGTDIFDVAVSTQLFNNRLVVGGSLGNRKYSTSKSANGEIVGDLDIELKLDRSGELRFKLFSHSADEYSSSLDFSQRNGLGFSYQKEYNRTRDFFRELFMSRRRKASEALQRAGKEKEYKTIEIE